MSSRRTIGFALILVMCAAFIPVSRAVAAKSWRRPASRAGSIHWTHDLGAGLARSAKEGKPVMVDFMAVWCPPCRAMDDSTFSSAEVVRKARAFIPVRIDIEKQRDVAATYGALARKYGGIGIPNILFMMGDGTKLKHIVGYYTPAQLVAAMDSALAAPR